MSIFGRISLINIIVIIMFCFISLINIALGENMFAVHLA